MTCVHLLQTALAGAAALLWCGAHLFASPEPAPTSPRAPLPAALQPYAAVGSSLAASSRLSEVGWTDEQIEAFVVGVRAGIRGESYPLDDRARELFASMSKRLKAIDAERRSREFSQAGRVEAFMKETCARLKLQRTDSGLGYGIMEGGAGIRPSPEDTVVFSMSATADDTETEIASLTREKVRVRVGDLMPGLAEGLQLMTIGSRALLVVPPELSFGNGTWPEGTVRGAPIFLIVGLHEIISPPVEP